MRDLIQFYVQTGVHGLFPLGSYGMGPALSIEQRKRVAKIVVEEVRGRIPIVLLVGAVDPYTTIELGLHGRSLNVDAIGMVGPYYYSDRTMPELLLHFKMVDKAVQLPIFIYNNPEYQGYPITLPMIRNLPPRFQVFSEPSWPATRSRKRSSMSRPFPVSRFS
jgi:dihydrodipicolinate synthase/N-acetylneuraminate lyase